MPISEDTILGANVKIHHPELVNIYGCKIGDNSIIGAFVEIKPGVEIGKNVKIQAGAFIPEGVTIQDEVFIGPHVIFTNDVYPRSTNLDGSLKKNTDWQIINTTIRERASIGANSTIICGVTIGKNSMIGAGSVVTKNIPPNSIAFGNPAKVIKKILKTL